MMQLTTSNSRAGIGGVPQKERVIVRRIRELLNGSPEGECRIYFLPWHGQSKNADNDLNDLVTDLDVPLLDLPSEHSSIGDARLLLQLAAFLPKEEAAEIVDALDQLPYSRSLERAALERIKQWRDHNKKLYLAIASRTPGPSTDGAMERVLKWGKQVGFRALLVLAQRKPPGTLQAISIPPHELRNDVEGLFSAAASQACGKGVVSATNASAARGTLLEKDPRKLRFYERILLYLGGDVSDTQNSLIKLQRREVDDWLNLLARLSAPNWGAARAIANEWKQQDDYFKKREPELRKAGKSLLPDNTEERDAAELKLRFLTLLNVLYPREFQSALSELDGADQLYRVYLILCGQTAGDSLLSSALLPDWQRSVDDPLFRELFHACFSELANEVSLVTGFESRTQLQYYLRWVDEGSTFREVQATTPMQEFLKQHGEWVSRVADRVKARATSGTFQLPDSRHLGTQAKLVLDALPTATEALQAAQALLSVEELERAEIHRPTVEELIRAALDQSRGGIRFDAVLLRARVLAIGPTPDSARALLRTVKRVNDDPLRRCAVQLEEAFVLECEGDAFGAVELYQEVLSTAEKLAADELVARAAAGCLRCDALARSIDTAILQRRRARIMLQIQAARAPQLYPLSERHRPKLFICYRSSTGPVMEAIRGKLREPALINAWVDTEAPDGDDIGSTIHQELLDSDAIVVLMSPSFFESPWCIHELHFALGQYAVRGIPIFWAWCDTDQTKRDQRCERAALQWLEANFDGTAAAKDGYTRFHVQNRLERLIADGRRLYPTAVIYSEDRALIHPVAEQLTARILQAVPKLYERARLPYPPA